MRFDAFGRRDQDVASVDPFSETAGDRAEMGTRHGKYDQLRGACDVLEIIRSGDVTAQLQAGKVFGILLSGVELVGGFRGPMPLQNRISLCPNHVGEGAAETAASDDADGFQSG